MNACHALAACCVAVCVALMAGPARAQTAAPAYPVKPIRLVVPLAAGGPSDHMAGRNAAPVLNPVSAEVRRIFELPEVKVRLKNYDYFLAPTTPEELDKILRADIATFSEVVRLAGLRAK